VIVNRTPGLAESRCTRRPSPVHFRAAPGTLGGWLRRIDKWIADANSVLDE
jgi:hypothetical protein